MDQQQPIDNDKGTRGLWKKRPDIRHTFLDTKHRAIDIDKRFVSLWPPRFGDQAEKELRTIKFIFPRKNV